MTEKRCCFAGHKDIYRDIRLQEFLYDKCEELIIEKNVKFFWVGNYGCFDRLAAPPSDSAGGTKPMGAWAAGAEPAAGVLLFSLRIKLLLMI